VNGYLVLTAFFVLAGISLVVGALNIGALVVDLAELIGRAGR
jgi:hypothetical protein